jgi:hypothetical protein
MSLTLKKMPGTQFRFSWAEDGKVVQWVVDGSDVDPSTLLDILDTVAPREVLIPPTTPMYPAGPVPSNPDYGISVPSIGELQRQWSATVTGHNLGAEAADRAARDEEMRLRNMGSALASGVGLPADAIPVVDSDRNDMGPVNWSA